MDSNIILSLQNFRNVARFSNNIIILKDWTHENFFFWKDEDFNVAQISRWLLRLRYHVFYKRYSIFIYFYLIIIFFLNSLYNSMINFNYFWNSVINIILEWTRPRRSWKRTWRAGTRRCGQSIIWQGQGNQEGRNWQERREWFWLRPSKSREIRVWFRSYHCKKKSWKIWTSIIARRFNILETY